MPDYVYVSVWGRNYICLVNFKLKSQAINAPAFYKYAGRALK